MGKFGEFSKFPPGEIPPNRKIPPPNRTALARGVLGPSSEARASGTSGDDWGVGPGISPLGGISPVGKWENSPNFPIGEIGKLGKFGEMGGIGIGRIEELGKFGIGGIGGIGGIRGIGGIG